MKNLCVYFWVAVCLSLAYNGISQERYLEEMFDSISVVYDQTYALNYSIPSSTPEIDTLTCDLYLPLGDTLAQRPIVVLLHGGSYLPSDT